MYVATGVGESHPHLFPLLRNLVCLSGKKIFAFFAAVGYNFQLTENMRKGVSPTLNYSDYTAVRDLLLSRVSPVGTERDTLLGCAGRVLAQEVRAEVDVPAFDRSPYDGYAFRASDTDGAVKDAPVTLRILEEVAAGSTPTVAVTPGTATKILTGAPIPPGADAVINYEVTEFTAETVKLFAPVKSGSNIVYAGEDVKKGTLLAKIGQVIDAGTAGTLAAQGIARPLVYRRPRVAILSTGSELVEADEPTAPGIIRNSNAYTIAAALRLLGIEPVYLGIARDTVEGIAELFDRGAAECDAVISTGGVSVGDYDLSPAALDRIGAEMLARGVNLKPGKACAYAMKNGKLICALSGNPASCITNLNTVALPALKKLSGRCDVLPQVLEMTLLDAFPKKSAEPRVLRGTVMLRGGRVELALAPSQGNVALSSTIGCDALAIVPAGSGALKPGDVLKGYML